MSSKNRLETQHLQLGYQQKIICQDINLSIPDGKFSVIIGPNGCGKSTLLRSLCRLLTPISGQIHLDDRNIHRIPTKELACQIALLPQTVQAPSGITVMDLVARGRFPHQGFLQQWGQEDKDAVLQAMQATGILELAEENIDALSGGQRQRVWIAMVLAQQTSILLLDEPTTYLDISHQIGLLKLFCQLNREKGHTLVAVLHDLNQACRYADHLIAMSGGKIIAEGAPSEIMTAELVKDVFDLDCIIVADPVSNTPLIIPA